MNENIVSEVVNGNKIACAKLISIVENQSQGYVEYLKQLYKHTGNAYVIGITGPPGAGKSTFVDKLVRLLRADGKKVGVIAIDPSSPFTKGAILGDRIRMNELSVDQGVFIRSMGTRGSLGGLSSGSLNGVKVLDAYGCDYVLIETVGVGQSEIDIVKTADTTLMLMVPGLGDDIQAIKAGVMEIGDIFVVNKADKDGAKRTAIEIEMMLDFKKDWDFRPPVDLVISETGEWVDKVYEHIKEHREYLIKNDLLDKRRLEKNELEILEITKNKISRIMNSEECKSEVEKLIDKTITRELDIYSISEMIIDTIVQKELLTRKEF